MVKVHHPTRWYFDPRLASWQLLRAGNYEEAVDHEADVTLSVEDTETLITALNDAGWIKPRLDDQVRQDDLKVTHRLLDIVEKLVEPELGQGDLEELITTHVVAHRAAMHREDE